MMIIIIIMDDDNIIMVDDNIMIAWSQQYCLFFGRFAGNINACPLVSL